MITERWRRIEEIFQIAVERDAAERDDFLTDACDGDSDLLREIESLLAFEVAARPSKQPFRRAIESAARSLNIEPGESEALADGLMGTRIGAYRVTGWFNRAWRDGRCIPGRTRRRTVQSAGRHRPASAKINFGIAHRIMPAGMPLSPSEIKWEQQMQKAVREALERRGACHDKSEPYPSATVH